jgi:hypothetical protein
MTTGLDTTGFIPETADSLLAEIVADQQAGIDPNLDTSAESLIGEINEVMVTRLVALWQLGYAVYQARRPGGASFAQLDDLCAITGTLREGATYGLVKLNVGLNAGITLPAGSVASVSGQPSNRWMTTQPATNPSGSPAVVQVQARAMVTGPVVANAGTITVRATPVTGWTTVTNPFDAAIGHDIETDPQLRTRREIELSSPGTGTIPALNADLAAVTVDGISVVASVNVEANESDYFDAMGRPPHTIEAIVQFTAGLSGPDLTNARQAFANQLWASKPGGIDTVGALSATVLDVRGNPHTLRWTEPTDLPIFVAMTLEIDPTLYPGNAEAIAIVVAFGLTMRLGGEVVRNRLLTDLMELPGVVDVPILNIGVGFATGASNIQPNDRQLATFDSGDVTVATFT